MAAKKKAPAAPAAPPDDKPEGPLAPRLAAIKADPKRKRTLYEAIAAITDAKKYSMSMYTDAARPHLAALGPDLVAVAWEEFIAAPDDYRVRDVVLCLANAIAETSGDARRELTALVADGFIRAKPSAGTSTDQLGQWHAALAEDMIAPLSAALKRGDCQPRLLGFKLLLPHADKVDVGVWLAALGDSSKVARSYGGASLADRGPSIAPQLVPLLASKKADVRLSAAEVLQLIANPECAAIIEDALGKEKDVKVRAVLEKALAKTGAKKTNDGETSSGGDATVDVIALLSAEKKAKLPKLLDGVRLPEVKTKDGKTLPEATVVTLIARMTTEGPDLEDPLLRQVRAGLDDESSSALSSAIYKTWVQGSDSKHKWCVFQRGIFESTEKLLEVAHKLDMWTSSGSHHLAGWHLITFARHGRVPGYESTVDDALSWVSHWSHEAETSSLKSRAEGLLEDEREKRGLSEQALKDSIDPYVADDDEDRRAEVLPISPPPVYTFGGEEWRAVVSGKKLRLRAPDGTLGAPPGGKKDAPEAKRFSDFAKDVDRTLMLQARRLEDAMIGGRVYTLSGFRRAAAHPVLGALLSGLVCMAKDGGKDVFFRPENGEFIGVDGKTLKLSLGAAISIPHRMEIPDKALAAWKNQLTEKGIEQPFEQLDRRVYDDPEDLVPGDKKMKRAALAARLREAGLRHGTPEDAGLFYQSFRRFRGRDVVAVFNHGAISIRAGQDWSNDPEGISSVGFHNSKGDYFDDDAEVPAIVRSEAARILAALLA